MRRVPLRSAEGRAMVERGPSWREHPDYYREEPEEDEMDYDRVCEALRDACEYLRLATTWIEDTDRHAKMQAAWHRAEGTLRDA